MSTPMQRARKLKFKTPMEWLESFQKDDWEKDIPATHEFGSRCEDYYKNFAVRGFLTADEMYASFDNGQNVRKAFIKEHGDDSSWTVASLNAAENFLNIRAIHRVRWEKSSATVQSTDRPTAAHPASTTTPPQPTTHPQDDTVYVTEDVEKHSPSEDVPDAKPARQSNWLLLLSVGIGAYFLLKRRT